ncbi:hypothetical protein O0L34_g8976 [Tuta absoluta]|nr:hypothetical protein O0L34_g8976 [Tuta absoluta]
MSSFHKTLDSQSGVLGTKLKNNLLYVSSGIPSLDYIIGGGLPTGSVFLVEEDVLGTYSRVLSKYFLAEGFVCNHDLLIATAAEDPQDIVKELPQPCMDPAEVAPEANIGMGVDKMQIAWRYEGLKPVESSFGSNTSFGHHFDLSKRMMMKDEINYKNITYWSPSGSEQDANGFKNPMYYSLLNTIKEAVSKEEHQNSSKNKKILRISIQSIGSPLWLAMDCEEETVSSDYGQDLIKFMYCLRVMLRDTSGVAFVTIPAHLFDGEHTIRRLLYSVDNAVRIESFAGSSRETNPVYKDYHGLFHITKLSAIYSLVHYVPPSLDLAFKLRRKKFVIEKLHLPPELQETSEREQDDITATPPTMSCGGFKKKDIDF